MVWLGVLVSHRKRDQDPDQDHDIGQFIQLLKGNKVESELLTSDANIMKRKKRRHVLRNGLLYKKCVSNNRETGYLQFVLPDHLENRH